MGQVNDEMALRVCCADLPPGPGQRVTVMIPAGNEMLEEPLDLGAGFTLVFDGDMWRSEVRAAAPDEEGVTVVLEITGRYPPALADVLEGFAVPGVRGHCAGTQLDRLLSHQNVTACKELITQDVPLATLLVPAAAIVIVNDADRLITVTRTGMPIAAGHFGMTIPVRFDVGLTVITSLTVEMFPLLARPVPALNAVVPPWVRSSFVSPKTGPSNWNDPLSELTAFANVEPTEKSITPVHPVMVLDAPVPNAIVTGWFAPEVVSACTSRRLYWIAEKFEFGCPAGICPVTRRTALDCGDPDPAKFALTVSREL